MVMITAMKAERNSRTSEVVKGIGQGKAMITGHWTSKWCGSHRYRGWSLKQFNKLVKMVQHDRSTDMHFQVQYEIWLKECFNKKNKEKHPKSNGQERYPTKEISYMPSTSMYSLSLWQSTQKAMEIQAFR